MKYPSDWVVTPGSEQARRSVTTGSGPPGSTSPGDAVSSGSTASDEPDGVARRISYNKSHFKAKLLVNKNTTVAGWPARLLIFSGVDNGVKMYFQRLNVARGRVGYFITMDGLYQDAKADKTLFREIYLTFKPRP